MYVNFLHYRYSKLNLMKRSTLSLTQFKCKALKPFAEFLIVEERKPITYKRRPLK